MVFCKHNLNARLGDSHRLIVTRNMKHFEESAFFVDISSIRWGHVVNKKDKVNVMVKKWSSFFSAVIDKHAPMREMKVSYWNCPWLNKELKSPMKSRDKLKKSLFKRKSPTMMVYL